MNIFQAYKFFLKNLSVKEKIRLIILTISSLFLSILEFLSIILIYPFILSLQNLSGDQTIINDKIEAFRIFLDYDLDGFVKLLFFLIIIFFILFNILNLILLYNFSFFWSKIIGKLTFRVFRYYTEMEYLNLLNINNASILKDIIFEVKRFVSMFIAPISTILNKLFTILIMILGVTYIEPKISLIMFGLLFVYYFSIYKILKKIAKQNSQGLSAQFQKVIKSVDETINNFTFFKISNLLRQQSEKLFQSSSKLNRLEAKNDIIAILPKYILEIIFFVFGMILIFYLFGENLFFIYLAKIALIFIVFIKIAPSFQLVYSLFISVKGHYTSAGTLQKPLNYVSSLENLNQKEIININNLDKAYEINVQNLSFRYANNKNNLFENFSYKFKKDKIYAIKGESGIGKSTLMNILSGLIENYKGDIYFNSKNLRNIDKLNWYNKISIVPQNVFINEDTLLNNVILDEEKQTIKTEIDKANYAILKSGLKNFVEKLENGTNTLIKNNAKLISGGEKQRLAIARAIYKSSDILFFDEPVNNLDTENINKFKETLNEIKKDKIIIIIAHQKELYSFCDEIIYIGEKIT
jgi:ABC-type multidrug transport system fused ATPase/permease subunit|tara:strand:- start:1592 stop:3334 length:1743 start_codon:yes stop_codon:yes gene_type:complete